MTVGETSMNEKRQKRRRWTKRKRERRKERKKEMRNEGNRIKLNEETVTPRTAETIVRSGASCE